MIAPVTFPARRVAGATLLAAAWLALVGATGSGDLGGPDLTTAKQENSSEIRDPFLGWVAAVVEGDSLGTWSGDQIAETIHLSGRPTRLPVEHIRSLTRRATGAKERQRRAGEELSRIWTITLDDNLHLPMPYSILGYHPGTLLVARQISLGEWRLHEACLHGSQEGEPSTLVLTKVAVFRLEAGWVVLDVDGWLDRLLGRRLDDTWCEGFALGRVDGSLQAVAMGANRKLQPLFGELDLSSDAVVIPGRRPARALKQYARPFVAPPPAARDRRWH